MKNLQTTHENIKVPFYGWIPSSGKAKKGLVLIHYQGGSKESWLEESFLKLWEELQSRGIALFAFDLYGHGQWESEDASFSTEDLNEENYRKCVYQSAELIAFEIKNLQDRYEIESWDMISWSFGTMIASKILARGVIPKKLVMAAPVPEKEYNDEFSFHNNLSLLEKTELLMISGTEDEDVAEGEVKWFFEQLKSSKKKLIQPNCGHSLPDKWIDWTLDYLDL